MNYPLQQCKQNIIHALHELLSAYTIDIILETPPENLGDFAFPCFSLAPLMQKSPQEIATTIAATVKTDSSIATIQARGGYVNFFIEPTALLSSTIDIAIQKDSSYGHLPKKKKNVIIEHTSANPNGPLHVGRARNPIIGDTLVRVFKAAGYDVESQYYLDDMGKQVAILAWGVTRLKKQDVPKPERNKPDHAYVGYYQVANQQMENDSTVAQEIDELINKVFGK